MREIKRVRSLGSWCEVIPMKPGQPRLSDQFYPKDNLTAGRFGFMPGSSPARLIRGIVCAEIWSGEIHAGLDSS